VEQLWWSLRGGAKGKRCYLNKAALKYDNQLLCNLSITELDVRLGHREFFT